MPSKATKTGHGVPEKANRTGETQDQPERCAWVERSIWTERMLDALETGYEGKWYSLMDKVSSEKTLKAAAQQVRRNRGASGIDGMSMDHFTRAEKRIIPVLAKRLKNGSYEHRPVKRVWIEKPGKPGAKRPLGIPTVIDRVVQTAVHNALEPIFEMEFHPYSHGFRPERSAQDALIQVLRELEKGRRVVVDADLKSFLAKDTS